MNATLALLNWYDANKRTLPWRDINDPYATWVSEIMLQQTRVETVLRYFPRFMERFPTVQALADAGEDEVLKMWEGLGYYSRARNLHKGAKQVAAEYGGAVPRDADTLRKISGIGDYTAGAIASIACGQAVPAVDGNVIRVISRLRGVRENVGIPSVKRQITELAAALVPQDRPGDFNQALMDLGSRVCVPGTPDCAACPLQPFCDAFDAGDAEDLPQLPRKNPPKVIDYDVLLLRSPSGRVLVRQRTEAMLRGLWVFPMAEGHQTGTALKRFVRQKLKLTAGDVAFLQ
ncbi:MAG: A/G-specific adenine glycosylase [Clostridia bacterium]|nr:A/G-specific adenine glycosylase [Clostridia bacterium]